MNEYINFELITMNSGFKFLLVNGLHRLFCIIVNPLALTNKIIFKLSSINHITVYYSVRFKLMHMYVYL